MTTHAELLQAADDLGAGIERVTVDRVNLRAKVTFAETMLSVIAESATDEKTRALAQRAIAVLKEMP